MKQILNILNILSFILLIPAFIIAIPGFALYVLSEEYGGESIEKSMKNFYNK